MMKDRSPMDEDYIISESAEISVGESPQLHWLLKAFPAFKSRDYSLYFVGQIISMIGTWLQMVAQGWLVLTLTNSAFLIGLVAALGGLPALVFSLIGGYIIDRYPKKKILIITNVAAMILAFILGFLTIYNIITIWEIMVLAFFLGVVTAIDVPARQAYVTELVERKELASAIALNAGNFNAARVIGPSVAGLLIAIVGIGGAFILNGISYIAAIVTLNMITAKVVIEAKELHPIKAIKEGIAYAASHPVIKNLMIFTSVMSVFGWSHITIMPVIAKNTFHFDAAGLGYLFAASGTGAVLGTVIVSAFAQKISPTWLIFGGNILFAGGLILFTYTTNIPLAFFFLFVSGLGLLLEFATVNTTIQHSVGDEMRGRVMSLYILMFLGFLPVGNFMVGYLAEAFNAGFAIRFGAVVMLLYGFYLWSQRGRIRAAQQEYLATK